MLDLVNSVRPGRGLVGWRREAGLNELGVCGKPPSHTLDQHAVNLGSRSQESIVMPSLFQGWRMITGWMGLAPFGDLGGAHFLVLWAHNEAAALFPMVGSTLVSCNQRRSLGRNFS